MKRMLVSLAVALVVAFPCLAVKVTLFSDTETFVQHARDIVIAKCVGPVPDGDKYIDGLYPVDVQVVSVIKGGKKPGIMKVATIYPMSAGKTYLLSSLGGSAFGTDLLAIPQLSVVELPPNFDVVELKNKTAAQQVRAVFAARRLENERQLHALEEEKQLLEKAVPK